MASRVLVVALKFANFDIVSANYDVTGTATRGAGEALRCQDCCRILRRAFGLGISPVGLITPANFKV